MSNLQDIVVLRRKTGDKAQVYTLAHSKGVVVESSTWNNYFNGTESPLTLNKVIDAIPLKIDNLIGTLSLEISGRAIALKKDGVVIGSSYNLPTGIGEAPSDGKQYVRSNGTWVENPTTVIQASDVPALPVDELTAEYLYRDQYLLSSNATMKVLNNTVGWVAEAIDNV